MALITAAQARERIPSLEGSTSDTLLDTMIAALGAAFARYCEYPAASVGGNPTMESASYTRYLDGSGTRELVLDVWPVTAITSIEDDPTEDFDGSTYLVTASDYGSGAREGNRGLVLLKATASHGVWNEGRRNIKAAFTAGFSTVPNDLQEIAKMAARDAWEARNHQGKKSQSQGDTSTTWNDDDFLTAPVRRALAPFRLPRAFL